MNSPAPICLPVNPRSKKLARDWAGAGPTDHFVQFYRTDDYLIECLSAYVADGLEKGDAVLVIATPSHRLAVEDRLRMKRVNVTFATAQRQYVSLDAEEVLAKFIVDGRPDPEAFQHVVGGIVRQVTAEGRKLRAFGEMVALLWQAGKRDAALGLEELWNELGSEHAFALFCAYPQALVDAKDAGPSLEHICRAHSRVISLSA
ncbi:MAG TPA: MEDS domain-containing protein [Opitutaceae bacterium]|nr:MEDS domain-containing protein [Opitutaceae bacterium]